MLFRRVFHYYLKEARKYKGSSFLSFAGYGLAIVFSSIVNPYLYKEIVDLVSGGLPTAELREQVIGLVMLVALNIVVYQLLYRLGDYSITYFQANVIREIHDSTFQRILGHSYRFFSNNFAGALVTKSKRFAASFERISDIVSFNFWFTFVHMAGVLVVLFLQAPVIASLFLPWAIIYIFITFLFIRKKVKYDLAEASADSRVTARFADAIGSVLNIKIFTSRNREADFFKEVTTDEYKKRKRAWNFGNFQNLVQGLLMGTLQIIVLYAMIDLWFRGMITTGTIILIQIYMFAAFDHLWELGKALVRLFKSLADAEEMVQIFDQESDIKDDPNPEKCLINKGEIAFINVSFGYVEEHGVFNDFNLRIAPGEKIGLVGYSGSGKSTIVKMILRFADIMKGEILIDGQNIAKIRQEDLRQKLSYVPQYPILFHRSIRENIAYSKPGASEEEIVTAAKKAHAHEFISELPHGYDTMVGERGVKLSGGERQRVAIARTMLKDAPIIMLDEATSSLDSLSESYIQDAFSELMKGKTTIVIAHRLSTVQKMDRIVVLDSGRIVEEGTHKELLAMKGFYSNLWNRQTGGFLE